MLVVRAAVSIVISANLSVSASGVLERTFCMFKLIVSLFVVSSGMYLCFSSCVEEILFVVFINSLESVFF